MILRHPVTVGGVRLGLDTLIYCGASIVAGFQAVLFSMLSRKYVLQEGLYPKTASVGFPFWDIGLEWGLVIGFTVLLIGIAIAVYALFTWSEHGFGELVTERIARLVIPSSIAMSLGLEIIFSSFLMSTLALSIRHHSTAPLKEYSAATVAV